MTRGGIGAQRERESERESKRETDEQLFGCFQQSALDATRARRGTRERGGGEAGTGAGEP